PFGVTVLAACRHHAVEGLEHVVADVRIGVLVDGNAGGRMRYEKMANPFHHADFAKQTTYRRRDVDDLPRAGGFVLDFMHSVEKLAGATTWGRGVQGGFERETAQGSRTSSSCVLGRPTDAGGLVSTISAPPRSFGASSSQSFCHTSAQPGRRSAANAPR